MLVTIARAVGPDDRERRRPEEDRVDLDPCLGPDDRGTVRTFGFECRRENSVAATGILQEDGGLPVDTGEGGVTDGC